LDEYFTSFILRLHPNGFMMRSDQTRGMYGLRRGVEDKATVKTEAAATGAKIALIVGLNKLCWFILAVFLLFFKFCAKYRINFYLCKEKVN
jgi:hypothetical protein